jgi:hypothetical protein
MVAGVGFDPVLGVTGALAAHFLAHHGETQNLTDEIDDLLGPGEPALGTAPGRR